MSDASTTAGYYEDYRQYLLGVAYRMLGSVHDAEEAVQETFLRCEASGKSSIEYPRAWLTRICTRICLDRMKRLSAKVQEYPGQWLPEPYVESEDRIDIDETLSMALLVALGALNPRERATFLLHDIFGYSFVEVADTLELNAATCRQLAVRARKKVRQARIPPRADRGETTRITDVFLRALRDGDAEGLRDVLADDVKLHSDGGGKVVAVPYVLAGRAQVHTFLMRIYRPFRNGKTLRTSPRWFNGAPGLLVEPEGESISAFQFDIEEGRIKSIFVQRNPDKLRRLV